MPGFQLRTPVDAIQYALRHNEEQVADLVRKGSSSSVSYSNGHRSGHLHIYGGDLDLYVADGEWVANLAGRPIVLTQADFDRLFVAVTQ